MPALLLVGPFVGRRASARRRARESGERLAIDRLEIAGRRTVDHGALGSETGTVTRAVPRAGLIVPAHDAAQMRTHRRTGTQHAVSVAIDGKLLQPRSQN